MRKSVYRRTRSDEDRVRVVAVLPETLISEVDAWGVPAGMPSRTEAIRKLLEAGLMATKNKKGAEPLTA